MKEIAGIYKITCITTSQSYIGYSRNIKNRWYNHKRMLKAGTHYNSKMQYLWDCFGSKSFVFDIVECCQLNEMKARENYYVRQQNPSLNIADTSNGPTKEYIKRMRHRKERLDKRLKKMGYKGNLSNDSF